MTKKIFYFNMIFFAIAGQLGVSTSQTPISNLDDQLLRSSITDGAADIARLLRCGANVNAKNEKGETLLYLAAGFGRLDVVQLLVSTGADVNAATKDGETPLVNAAHYGLPEVLKYLLERGANVHTMPDIDPLMNSLHGDAGEGVDAEVEKAILLIQHGAEFQRSMSRGETALMWTAQQDDFLPVLKLLIEKGASLETRDEKGNTALAYAVRDREIKSVTVLLDHGANIETRDKDGTTPLMFASEYGYIPIARLLLARGARVNVKDSQGRTALVYASLAKDVSKSTKASMVNLLRNHGAR